MPGRRELTPREVLAAAAAGVLLAVVMHWPLVLDLGEVVPKDLGDPLAQTWQAAWGGHALANQPLEFFQANQFWPLPDTLAFSDSLAGYAPAGLVGEGVEAAIARYDLLFLAAYALAFWGAYLLARELGLGRGGAAVAGAAFAFAPFRLEHDGHLQVLSSGGIPLALAAGLHGLRLRRPGWLLAGWALAAWQLSLGFALGIPFSYLLATLALLGAIAWLRRDRPPLERRMVVAGVAGALAFAAVAVLLVRPYLRVADHHPQSTRSPAVVEEFSAQPAAFLATSEENLVWGEATAAARDGLTNVPEQALFPGLVILALAVAGTASRRLPRGVRLGLAAGTAAVAVLALGFRTEGGLLWPYRVVYELLPGWEAIRTPGRLWTFASLGLALLAGAGAQAALAALRAHAGPRAGTWAAAGAGALVLAVLVEGRGLPFDPTDSQAQPGAPQADTSFAAIAAPQLHLPAERPEDNRRYLLWSTDGFAAIVNGRSSIDPAVTRRLIAAARGFPDRASVATLRRAGIASVVLHPRRAPGTPWAGAAARPVAGLAVRRERRGEVVIYSLAPAPAPPG